MIERRTELVREIRKQEAACREYDALISRTRDRKRAAVAAANETISIALENRRQCRALVRDLRRELASLR